MPEPKISGTTVCDERHQYIKEQLELHNERLNAQSAKIDSLEKDYTGAVKDIGYLKSSITELKDSIDKLIVGIDNLKLKPLAKYEQIAMFIITAVIAYVLGKVL